MKCGGGRTADTAQARFTAEILRFWNLMRGFQRFCIAEFPRGSRTLHRNAKKKRTSGLDVRFPFGGDEGEKQTAAAPMPAKMRRHSGYRQNRRGALDFRWNSDEAFNDPGPDTCVRKAAEEKQKENFRQGANRNPFVHCGHRSVCRFQFSAPPSVWRCASRAGREDPGG